MNKKKLMIGDIVQIVNMPFEGRGYVYHTEHFMNGLNVNIITEKGVDLGGFNPDAQEDNLIFIKSSGYYYYKGYSYNSKTIEEDFNKTIKLVFEKGFTYMDNSLLGKGKEMTKYLKRMAMKYFPGYENYRVDWEDGIIVIGMDWSDEDTPFYVITIEDFLNKLKPKK